MEGSAGGLAGALLFGAFVGAALVPLPSRSKRGWSLLSFTTLAGLVGGMSVAIAGLMVLSATIVAVGIRAVGWRYPPQPWVDGVAALALLASWAVAGGLAPMMLGPVVGWLDIGLAVVIFLAWFGADTLLRITAEPLGRPMVGFQTVRFLRDWPVAVVVFSLALTFGAVWWFTPLWAILVSCVPLVLFVVLYTSLLRHEEIEWATVRALGRLPEAAGASLPGHSVATARIAVEMGKLGACHGRDLDDLEKAALLHDLGLVFCSTRQIRKSGFTHADIARWSAELVGESTALAHVGRLIEDAAEPYRVPGADPDPDIDVRSRILAVACRSQELLARGMSTEDCVEALNAESRYRYAPQAVRLASRSLVGAQPV